MALSTMIIFPMTQHFPYETFPNDSTFAYDIFPYGTALSRMTLSRMAHSL